MIEISLFGQVGVRTDGQLVTDLSGKRRQILAILALEADSPVSKERLAELLWQGAPPVSYVGTLDSYVCVLRRRLGLGAGRGSQLATTDTGFMLSTGGDVQIDLTRFHVLARSSGAMDVVQRAELALETVTGDLVADEPYADWALRARDAFRYEAVQLWLEGARVASARGEWQRAQRLARAVTRLDPVCEDAWRQVMVANWSSGQRGHALTAYAELRDALAECLGVDPGRDSQELYLTILRDLPATGTPSPFDMRSELQALLRLLRQTLDCSPGIRVPAGDAGLSAVAVQAIADAC
jgi:DNA-binding SARP family transcriptional activator